MIPRTLEAAKDYANIGYQVTGAKFGVIPDPDCEGYFMAIPVAQHAPEVDPPMVYQTPKGKVF